MKSFASCSIKPFFLLAILIACLCVSFVYLRWLNPWFLFDFIEYWSAGLVLLAGQNPYDPATMLAAQQTAGWQPAEALMMWNPPWVMPMVIPLAWLDYASSRTAWFFVQVAALVISAVLTWKVYAGERKSGSLITIAAGILTGAVFWMLFYGQISFLILLGAAGFLALVKRGTFKADFLAGAAAVLITIKPQSFYLIWPALLIWVLSTRRWGALWGGLSALGIGLLMGSAFYPGLLAAYFYALQNMPPTAWYTPTIGYWLRAWFGFERFWLQFVLVLPALALVVIYTWRNRRVWRWEDEMPLLILVSLATSAYAWTHDQVIFLIPFVYLAVRFLLAEQRRAVIVFAIVWIILNLSLFVGHFFFQEHYFAWLAPLSLILFLIARRVTEGQPG
jgi:hypothetical protein